MSVIQTTIITANLLTLSKITTANGYNTNVSNIKRGIRSLEDFEGQLPGLALWRFKNVREDSFQPGSESRLQFRIYGYVNVEPLENNYTALDNLVADVEKVLMSATHNPSYYTHTFIGETTFYEGGTEMDKGIFEMAYEVSYFYKFTQI